MDPSEGNTYWKNPQKAEFPPLYESVNGKETDSKSRLCPTVNRLLLPFKAYYFFFYGAIGALFPFIALYYRHLWLSPTQTGLLVGLRPIVQALTVPLWAIAADKWKVKKLILLVGLCGWLLTHASILLVPAGEKPLSCSENVTLTDRLRKRSLDGDYATLDKVSQLKPDLPLERSLEINGKSWQEVVERSRIKSSDQTIDHSFSDNRLRGTQSEKTSQLTPPGISAPRFLNSSSMEKNNKIHSKTSNNAEESMWTLSNVRMPIKTWHTFAFLCFIIVIGNLFSSPAQTMANTATLHGLAANSHKYGTQRCFGSIGWGCAAFVVGMLVSLNHDSTLACDGLDDINYTPCFYAFGVFMLFALAVALFFKFEEEEHVTEMQPGLLRSLRQELDCLTCFVLFTALLAGFNMGFIQTFLFWHLQTLGGTQTLFSLMTGLNAVGEMIGFILSVKLIERFGHLKVMSLGLAAYAIRLLVYGLVKAPWYVLTVELLKGFTSSAIWASILSFIGLANGSAATLQSLLHMLYWGVGYGGGGMLGGVLMEFVGASTVFLALAFISIADMFAILLVLNLSCFPKRRQDVYMPVVSDEEEEENNSESEQ